MFRRLLLLLILVAGLFISQASGAAIAGLSYLDANGDGKYDTQFDSPLPGWDIRLFAQDGVLIATTKTDRNGFFVFDELPPGGTYLVEEVRPRGWVGIGGAISTVVLSSETPTEDSFHIDDDAGLRVRIPEEYLVFSTGSHVGGIGPCSLVSNARFGPVGASGGEDPAVCAAWRNGDVVPFSLGYDPATGKVTYMVGGRTSTWEVPESNREPIMHLALHTQADAPGTRVDLFGLRMAAEGMPGVSLPDTEIGGENTAIGRGTRGHDVLYLDMDAEKFFGKNIGATSFVLTGYQRIVWDPVHPPSSQTFGFVIEAGARTFPETDIRYAKFDGTAKDTKSAPVVSELAAPEPTTTVKAKETVEPTTVKTTETPEPTKTVKGTETPESTTTVKAKETAEPTTVKTTETPEPTKTVKGTETPEPTTTVKAKETAEPTTVETTETPEPTKTVKGTDTVSRGVAGSSPGTGTGSISGSKWHDLDGDHKWDSGEPTLSGWTIYLEMQEENGSNWLPMGSASTDSSGRYSFSGLAEGHYRVFEESRSGWEQTFPTNNAGKDEGKGSGIHNLVISNGQPSWTGQDFGNLGLTTATPTTTATTVEPTVSETTVEPTVTETTVEPTVSETTVEPTVTATTVEPTVSETTVEPTVTETTVEPTVSETTVEPTVTETTVEPTGTITEGQPPTGTVTPEPTTPAGTGSISGSKWHDLDGDHKWDSGEPTLSGWTIYLEMQEENGSNWLPIGSVLTDANGRYSFTGLAEGHYRVYEVVPSGWEQTFPTNNAGMHNLVISNGQPSWDDRDFGNLGLASPTATITEGQTPTGTMTPTPEPTTPTRTGMITVIKFNDLNGNGLQDDDEPGIEGWLMTLYHDAVPIAVQATGSGGSTVFNNLDSAGEFLVTEETRDGWNPTTPALAHVNFSTSMEVTVRIGNWIPPTTVPTTTETTVEPTVTMTTVEPTVTETTVVPTVTETTVEPTITDVRPPTVTETTAVPTETGTPVGTMTPEPTITDAHPPTVTETTAVPTETGTPVGTITPEPTITDAHPPTVTETTAVPTETGTPVGTMTPEPTITDAHPPTVTETTAVPTETGTPVGTMTPEPTITEGQPPTTTATTSTVPTSVTTPGQTGTPGPTPADTTAGTTAPTTVPGTLQPTLTPTGTSPVPTDQGPQPTRTGVPTIRTQEPTATPTPWPTGTFVLPTPPIDMPTPVSGLCPAPQVSTGDETLITGPTRITSPGFYRFADSFVDVNETVWLEVVASNVTIDGNGHTLDGRDGFGTHGIRVMNGETVDRLFVQNLTVTDFAYGISLYNTTNSTIVFVNASSNTYDGIMTSGGADNLIACNIIHQDDDGINLTGTDRTVVINNTVTENFRGSGIHLAGGADGVRLLANRIGYNDEGIEVEETANSEIAQNLIWESRFYGLNLTSAENLTVFDNYVRNRQNIRPPTGPFTATWNLSAATGPNLFGGSTIGGNFWGDLNRTGFSETHLDNNRDGFVDVPYVLPDGAGIDWRPLAPPVNGVDRAMIGTANSWRDWLMTFLT